MTMFMGDSHTGTGHALVPKARAVSPGACVLRASLSIVSTARATGS